MSTREHCSLLGVVRCPRSFRQPLRCFLDIALGCNDPVKMNPAGNSHFLESWLRDELAIASPTQVSSRDVTTNASHKSVAGRHEAR